MPELPDVTVYIERLRALIGEQRLEQVRLASPFLVRSVDPPIRELAGKRVVGVRRIGKRIALGLEDELFCVLHLMIAGRLHWKERGAKIPGRVGLAAFDFSQGTILFTEASSKKRASI
ncbi:MAG TPA: DNA-formamidopyrimidine glycosylase family protein, partial [Myxococcaceae bacterium]|nr:DNA-formamidopyrimidine glycosylase family protein [Myxococcaceae bacterium]